MNADTRAEVLRVAEQVTRCLAQNDSRLHASDIAAMSAARTLLRLAAADALRSPCRDGRGRFAPEGTA